MKKRFAILLVLSLGLSACSQTSLKLPDLLGGKREIVTFSESLYRPQQEFEKISCKDLVEQIYASHIDDFHESGSEFAMENREFRFAVEGGIKEDDFAPKILFAAAVSAVGKLFHKRGWFYKIAGYKARSIDGPCDYTLPPYNEYVVLGPAEPDETAKKMSQRLGGIKVAITDINDLEGQILGTSDPSMDRDLLVKILKDNPLGQSLEQTPIGIIRKA